MPKILLVDDSKAIQRVAKLILQGSAYSLITSDTSKNAENLVNSEVPDVSLVDLSIGADSGLELIKVFRSNPSLQAMKVVLLHSHLKKSQMASLEGMGIDAKLEKPFDAPALLNILDELSKAPHVPAPPTLVEMPTDDTKQLFEEEEVDQYLDKFLKKPSQEAKDPKETIEDFCRKIIPPLAERIIREELQKLLKE